MTTTELYDAVSITGKPVMGGATYFMTQSDNMSPIVLPHTYGWLATNAECFNRRTKDDFVLLFKKVGTEVWKGGLIGFRDTAELNLCILAAKEAGAEWDYPAWAVTSGELGCLNMYLQEYYDNYIPGAYPKVFPVPTKP